MLNEGVSNVSGSEKTAQQPNVGQHPRKILLRVWWFMQGIIYYELLNKNQIILAKVFC